MCSQWLKYFLSTASHAGGRGFESPTVHSGLLRDERAIRASSRLCPHFFAMAPRLVSIAADLHVTPAPPARLGSVDEEVDAVVGVACLIEGKAPPALLSYGQPAQRPRELGVEQVEIGFLRRLLLDDRQEKPAERRAARSSARSTPAATFAGSREASSVRRPMLAAPRDPACPRRVSRRTGPVGADLQSACRATYAAASSRRWRWLAEPARMRPKTFTARSISSMVPSEMRIHSSW